MIIRQIITKNFRTLEDVAIAFRPGYCTISGKNNAGKTAIIKVIEHFLKNREDENYFFSPSDNIVFSRDRTQWSDCEKITLQIDLELDKSLDSEVFFVVETFAKNKISKTQIKVSVRQAITRDEIVTECFVDGEKFESRNSIEILKKFRSAPNIITHNSTNHNGKLYYHNESFTEILEAHFSSEDRERISGAQKTLQTKVRKAARQHKTELDGLLGKLNEKYEVELSAIQNPSQRFPLQINLKDKSVGSPLGTWGAGTQNRTRVLMSILEAVHIRKSSSTESQASPVILIEEPESFLHPSAQAEFGRVLSSIATEFGIQIIATTHSPYMLNQSDADSNFLLERKMFRGAPRETEMIDSEGPNWMLPFAEILGVTSDAFTGWDKAFSTKFQRIILVEGETDKKYFEYFKTKYPAIYGLDKNIEIIPYGGCDALKNHLILKLMIDKFDKVFITFDLDGLDKVENSLRAIDLKQGKDYCSIGNQKAGHDCIEGLLPDRVKKSVYSEHHELVAALGSRDTKERNVAKKELKQIFLDSVLSTDFQASELNEFRKLFSTIGKAF